MAPRIKAFLIHLGISIVVALAAMALVFGLWYPSPLHTALGVTDIFLLLLAVDVVLGPCLTLVVFKPGKKTLLFDLAVIALLQIAALVYGLYTMAEARPAWLVFAHDRFDVVRVVDINTEHIDEAASEYRHPSWFGPQWVALPSFNGTQAQNSLQLQSLLTGNKASTYPALYQPLASQKTGIRVNALPLERLANYNPTATLEPVLANHPQADSWLPLSTTHQDMVVLINKEQGEVVALVDLRPWYVD